MLQSLLTAVLLLQKKLSSHRPNAVIVAAHLWTRAGQRSNASAPRLAVACILGCWLSSRGSCSQTFTLDEVCVCARVVMLSITANRGALPRSDIERMAADAHAQRQEDAVARQRAAARGRLEACAQALAALGGESAARAQVAREASDALVWVAAHPEADSSAFDQRSDRLTALARECGVAMPATGLPHDLVRPGDVD